MFKMTVNLYKSFVCSGTSERDNETHWLSAYLQTSHRKSQASQYLRHLEQVTRIDQVHTFTGTTKEWTFLKACLDASLSQTSRYYPLNTCFMPCWSAYDTLFIEKGRKVKLFTMVHSHFIIHYFSTVHCLALNYKKNTRNIVSVLRTLNQYF